MDNKQMIRFRRSQAVAGLTTGRITAFSDGIFSIAITLLVLNLQIPKLTVQQLMEGGLNDKVLALWPNLLVFFLFPLYYIFPSHIDLHLTPTSCREEKSKEHEGSTGEDTSISEGEEGKKANP